MEGTAYSASVLGVRERLGPDTAVTAAQIAEALQVDHPTYGGETFAKVRLRTSDGPTRATDEWLAGVSELYTPDAVAASKHQVIDGVLVLLGLAELDATLEEDLRSRGFLARLRLEANVLPRTDVQDHTRWASDSPADDDQLGREPFAKALAKRLHALAAPQSKDRRSFLIHLDGPWGAGKSSLLGFLRRELEPTFLVVEINAWREQRVGPSWWTILDSVNRATSAMLPWYGMPITWWRGFSDRVRAGWAPFVITALIIAALLVGLATFVGPDLAAGAKAADSMSKIVALVSAAAAELITAARSCFPARAIPPKGWSTAARVRWRK